MYHRSIYNYRQVMDRELPAIDRTQFAEDLHVSLNDLFRLPVIESLVKDQLLQIITDVVFYKNTSKKFSNLPQQKYARLWNAYCIAYWPINVLGKSTVDKWGYIKYLDIGYEPKLIETAEDAYALGEKMANSG